SWVAEKLPLFAIKRDSYTLTGAGSYTIGPGATFNGTRPHKLRAAAVLAANGTENDVEIVGADQWKAYVDKTATGLLAKILYCDGNYPTATIYIAPKPSGGSLILYHYQ